MIIKRINQEIREWCNIENVNNITQELSDLFNRECKLIDAQCDEINKTLLDMPLDGNLLDFSEPNPTSYDDEKVLIRRIKIVVAVSSPLWVPLAIGAGIIAVPIVLGMKALQSVKAVHYRSNKLISL
jgi:hypothetical protein